MKKRNAVSAIAMLITLLISALLFLHFVTGFLNKKSEDIKKQPKEEVTTNQELEQKLEELQNLRQETQEAEQNRIKNLKENF